MPTLASTHHVYAPDLPGSDGSAKPLAEYSPAFFTRFVAAFVDTLEVHRTAGGGQLFGRSRGIALGVGRTRTRDGPGPGFERGPRSGGHLRPAIAGPTRLRQTGARLGQEAPRGGPEGLGTRGALVFARPRGASRKWLKEQYRLARASRTS